MSRGCARAALRPSLARRALLAVALGSPLARAQAPAPGGEVVVQAGPVDRPGLSRDDSVAGTVVTGRKLRAPGAEAADVLRGLPGVTVTATGGFGALATASLRGATSAQTPVYLAGVRINDDVGGTADLSTVPLWLVDRIEIYRGNAPPQADRLGIGGAIFFDPRRVTRPGASGAASAGSFGQRSARVSASAGGPSGGLLAGVSAQEAANDYAFLDDRGTRFDASDDRRERRRNADVHSRDLWLLGQAAPDPSTRLLALVNGVDREQGVPGLGLLPTRAARASLRRWLGAVRGERRCAEDRCQVTLGTSALLSDSTLDDPLRELALGGTSLRSRASRVEQSALARFDLGERVSASVALDAAFERLAQAPGGAPAAASSRRFSRGALAGVWKIHSSVELRALGAAECHGVERGALCDLAVPSGRVGALGPAGPGQWLVNAGRYGRAPTLGEREGVSAVVRGNPALRPEGGAVADAGWRGGGKPGGVAVGLEFFVFAQWISELVAYRRSSLGYLRPYNVGRTRTLGAELSARAAPRRWLLAEVAVTALDPRDTSPDRQGDNDLLPFRSRLQVAPSLTALLGALPALGLSEAALAASYLHQSSRYADGSGQVVLAAQGSLDLDLDTRWWGRRLGARLRAANVLDQARRDVVGYPLPGRSLHLSADLTWP